MRLRSLAVFGLIIPFSMHPVDLAQTGAGAECRPAVACAHRTRSCTWEDTTESVGPTVIADLPDGISSDGRGTYWSGKDGVTRSLVGTDAVIIINDTASSARAFSVDLSKPVPGGGGVPLGIITRNSVDHQQWSLVARSRMVGDTLQNLHLIAVGQTVAAAQMNVGFDLHGHALSLQMGPQSFGICHTDSILVRGTGTSEGTIYRPSRTKWVMDLPAGSVGRLWDLHDGGWEHPVDKGLYSVRLHYEIGR